MAITFKVTSGQIVISDPCYTIDQWCNGSVPAKNGEWQVSLESNNGNVNSIRAWHIASAEKNLLLPFAVLTAGELPFSFGVDSGQLGYFDRDFYRNDNAITDEIPIWDIKLKKPGDKFYSACCELIVHEGKKFGSFPFGVVTRSGYGDGSYPTTGIKDEEGNYIALSTVFCYDDLEDLDDEYDDEEAWEDYLDDDIDGE